MTHSIVLVKATWYIPQIMSVRAEKSPLYSKNFSKSQRRAIQLQNNRTIVAGMSRYEFQSGRKQIYLENLNLNGRETNEGLLGVFFNPTHTLLTYLEHPEADGMICRLDMRATEETMIDWQSEKIPFWKIEARIIETKQGYEGNGLAKALFLTTETIIPAWLHYLSNPSLVLAYHFDGARGAEEPTHEKKGYRTNWTGNLLSTLGYSNKIGTLEYYLGENQVKEMGTPDKHWIKVLRH